MRVTFTNTTNSSIYLSAISMSIPANGSLTTRRTAAQLDAEHSLKLLVAAGTVTLAFAVETGDTVGVAPSASLIQYSNATRPAANTVPTFTAIWNTSDVAVNWSDGTNWRDNAGLIT